jgi:hypothetical protein
MVQNDTLQNMPAIATKLLLLLYFSEHVLAPKGNPQVEYNINCLSIPSPCTLKDLIPFSKCDSISAIKNQITILEFEVLMAVTTKRTIFWNNIMSLAEVYQHFG